MEALRNEIVQGRKVFFILPDKSLIAPNFMEEYLNQAYECYIIDNDINIPIQKKIGAVLDVFKDSILFFNTDYNLKGLSWHKIIENVKNKYPTVTIGVIFAKRNSPAEKAAIENEYIRGLGIIGGCIELDYQKKNNYFLIEKFLFANQARGRRTQVRALCQRNCSFNLDDKRGNVVTYWLNDLSLSHFSFTVPEDDKKFNIKDYERVSSLSFVIKGIRFTSDAVLFLKRETPTGILYVFAFVLPNGQLGLDPNLKNRIQPKIYELLCDTCFDLLKKTYDFIEIDPYTGNLI